MVVASPSTQLSTASTSVQASLIHPRMSVWATWNSVSNAERADAAGAGVVVVVLMSVSFLEVQFSFIRSDQIGYPLTGFDCSVDFRKDRLQGRCGLDCFKNSNLASFKSPQGRFKNALHFLSGCDRGDDARNQRL